MALSDLVVRQAKNTGKSYTLNDIDGLSLAVSPTGGKSWHFRYYWADKQKRMSLGTYPEISLRDARALRDGARVLLTKGINPRVHRKQKRQSVQLADQNTFKLVFDKWVEHRCLVLKEGRQSTLSQIQRIFAKDVLPVLGRRSIYEIPPPDLLEVVARIERRSALTTADKVRIWFRQMFRYALVIVPGYPRTRRWIWMSLRSPYLPCATTPSCACPSYRPCSKNYAIIPVNCRPSWVFGCYFLRECAQASCGWQRQINSISTRGSGLFHLKWSSSCSSRCAREASVLRIFHPILCRCRHRPWRSFATCSIKSNRLSTICLPTTVT